MTTPAPAAEDLARATALLESVGFRLIRLAEPLGDWPLLCISPRGETLVAVVREQPELLGMDFQLPAGFGPNTVRLILTWPADVALPRALVL